MTQDRDGLQYKIEVVDAFTAQTQKFRSELLLSRKAFQAFKADVANVAKAQAALAQASIAQSRARMQAAREQRSALREEIGLAKQQEQAAQNQARFFEKQNKLRTQSDKQRRAVEASNFQQEKRELTERQRRVAEIARQEEAARRQKIQGLAAEIKQRDNNEKLRANIVRAERQAETQRAREAKRLEAEATRRQKAALRQQRELRQELFATDTTANRLAFTFRRLFGVLAAFTLAREGLQAFGALVKGGITFNNTIADSRIGFAGLISSLADVRSAQGELLKGSDAFNASLGVSQDLVKGIRQDALRTVATFEELLEVNQVALGPGLAAGLKVDEIRQVALQVSQAAAALRVPQNQLSEEIRALLTGSITDRTSRIATALQVRPDDIRNADKLGGIYQFLTSRLQGFNDAAERTAKNLPGTLKRLQGVVGEVTGQAAERLTTTLVAGFQDVIDRLTQTDVAGRLIPNPAAVRVFGVIFDAIDRIVKRAFAFVNALDLEKDVLPAMRAFVAIAENGLTILTQFVGGIATGLTAVAPFFAALSSALAFLSPVLGVLVQINTILFTLGLPVRALAAGFTLVSQTIQRIPIIVEAVKAGFAGLTAAQTASTAATTRWTAALGTAFAIIQRLALAFAGVAVAAKVISTAIFDFNVPLRESLQILTIGFVGGLRDIAGWFQNLGDSIGVHLSQSVSRFVNLVIEEAQTVANGIARALAFTQSDESKRFDAQTEAAARAFRERQREEKHQNEINALLARRNNREQEAAEQAKRDADEIGKLLAESTKAAGFDETFKAEFRSVEEILKRINDARNQEGATAAPRGRPVTQQQRDELLIEQQKALALQQEVELQQTLNALGIESTRGDEAALQAQLAQIKALQSKLAIEEQVGLLRIREAERAFDGARGDEDRVLKAEQLRAVRDQVLAQYDLEAGKIEAAIQQAEELRLVAQGTIGEGLSRGLANFAQEFGSAFKAGIEIARGAMQAFSAFIASSVVDAFDPTQDFDLKERFARFLQDIARLIIQQLAQIAIAKALLGIGFGGPTTGLQTGGSVPSFQGYAEGGKITPKPSAAHYGVRGLPRPKGLDPRDTTPIWAQPGEFMQPLHAVRAYGLDFMEALRRGAIDPSAVRGLMGMQQVRRMRTLSGRGPGYATGGAIDAARAVATEEAANTGGAPTGGPSPAYVIADEQSVDRLMTGGRAAVLNFLRRNKGDVQAILR